MRVSLVLLMMKFCLRKFTIFVFASQSQKAKFTQMAAPQKSAKHRLCEKCHENMEIYICNVKYVFLGNLYNLNMIAADFFFLVK